MDVESWLSGWADTHDYDPRWDYEVIEAQRSHPLLRLAQQTINQLSIDHPLPWLEARAYPVDLADEDAVALWVYGTESAPVVLLDLHKHSELGTEAQRATVDSVLHELRHAYQEAHGWELCEMEAEFGSSRIPF